MKSSYNLSELINSSLLSEYNDILNDTEEFNRLFSNDNLESCTPLQPLNYCSNTIPDDLKNIVEEIIPKKKDIINENIETSDYKILDDNINKKIENEKIENIKNEIEINGIEARIALKKKLEDKRNSIKNKKQPLITKEDNQINMLKNNPLFKNIENLDKESIKKIIDTVASSMTNDSKQKKNIKKQVEKLIDKMVEKKI